MSIAIESKKKYKAVEPEKTVFNIRKILIDNNIFTIEHLYGYENYYHSCRIILGGENIKKLDIGQNGKGMSGTYSLASGYAEFMERIQNRTIAFEATKYAHKNFIQRKEFKELKEILANNDINPLDFYICPDEVEINMDNEELTSLLHDYFPNSCNSVPKNNNKYHIIFAPFFDVNNLKTKNLPIELFRMTTGSTGMCAGNNAEEAILQGLYEVFERYILQKIYYEDVNFPSFSPYCFEGSEIYTRLELFKEQKNINYEIKDCSLNMGLPVIGLFLFDKNKNKYTFRLGADINPIIALERCFTEIYQGVNESNEFHFNLFSINQIDLKSEYKKGLINGTGKVPLNIFEGNDYIDKLPDNEISIYSSDAEILKYYLEKLKNNGYQIFIRDNSFLGFPTYYIYIPGMSDTNKIFFNLFDRINFTNSTSNFYSINPLYKIIDLKNKDIPFIFDLLQNKISPDINFFPYNSSEANKINKNLFFSILYFFKKEYSESLSYLNSFIFEHEMKTEELNSYYYCLRDYLQLYLQNKNTNILRCIYESDLVEEVKADLELENTFENLNAPNCFNCSSCNLRDKCSYVDVLRLTSLIQNKYKANVINQEELRNIFV